MLILTRLSGFGAGQSSMQSMTLVGTNTSSSANTNLPSGAEAGDLCYFFDSSSDTTASFNKSGDGWTSITSETNNNHWQALWYKVLTASDITQGYVTGYNGGTMAKGLAVFAPVGGKIASISVNGLQIESTANNPSQQTVDPTGGEGTTRIVMGWAGSNNTNSPSGTLVTNGVLIGAFSNRKSYFEIQQDGSFSSRTFDMADSGSNYLATWYLDVK